MTVKTVGPKTLIFREIGKPSADTHILLLGTAQVSHVSGNRSRALAIVSPGVIFKFPSMPGGIYQNFEVVALTPCRMATLPSEIFTRITLATPAADYEKMRSVWEDRVGSVLARYASFVDLTLSQRVVLTLLELVREFGVRDARGMLLRIRPTHQQIAELAGGSRSKVSKALVDLERDSVIVRLGRQLIVNEPRARGLLAFQNSRTKRLHALAS